MSKVKCWEIFRCKKNECPAYKSQNLKCWLFPGTHCRDEIQGEFIDKIEMCIDCEPFKINLDVPSMRDTCEVFSIQLKEYKRIVEDRDRELENISMELAIGLSEVFEALKKISSGDPLVRIPEMSHIELINKLKHLVNLTAQNIEEIVELSHEFAIGLAEHFDVLHKVSKGDINTRISDNSRGELLKALGKVTNQMIESVSIEITERKKAEERFKQVAESAGEWIWEVDENGLYTYSNHVVEKILGYSPEEIVGKKHFFDFFDPNISKQLLKEEAFAPFHKKTGFKNLICANIHKTGRLVFLERSGTPVLDKMGNFLGYRGVDTDITKRKLAEEHLRKSLREKEILLRELHHRTKNNLQVISSLLDLHSITIEDKNILNIIKEVQHRVKSIALVHEKLYQAKDLSDVNLKDYITDFSHALLKSYEGIKGRISLKVYVENIFLSLDTITPCGMIISELLSNSMKYAFPGGTKGRITIQCHLTDDGEVQLRISDNGVGLPQGFNFKNTKSLGFKLICKLVEDQLKGSIELQREKGTNFLIKFREIKPHSML